MEAKEAPNTFEEETWLDLAECWTELAETFRTGEPADVALASYFGHVPKRGRP